MYQCFQAHQDCEISYLWWRVQWSVEADFCCQHGQIKRAQKSLCLIRCDCFTSHKLQRECGHMCPRIWSWWLDLKSVLNASSGYSPLYCPLVIGSTRDACWCQMWTGPEMLFVLRHPKSLSSDGATPRHFRAHVLTFTHLSSILAAWMCTNRYKTVGTGFICAATCPIAVPEVLSTSWDHPFHL